MCPDVAHPGDVPEPAVAALDLISAATVPIIIVAAPPGTSVPVRTLAGSRVPSPLALQRKMLHVPPVAGAEIQPHLCHIVRVKHSQAGLLKHLVGLVVARGKLLVVLVLPHRKRLPERPDLIGAGSTPGLLPAFRQCRHKQHPQDRKNHYHHHQLGPTEALPHRTASLFSMALQRTDVHPLPPKGYAPPPFPLKAGRLRLELKHPPRPVSTFIPARHVPTMVLPPERTFPPLCIVLYPPELNCQCFFGSFWEILPNGSTGPVGPRIRQYVFGEDRQESRETANSAPKLHHSAREQRH